MRRNLKWPKYFLVETWLMFGTKAGWKVINPLEDLEPVQLQMPTLGVNAERRSRVLATSTENLIILLFNILRRVRVNPNSHQNTEKQESDCTVCYYYDINVHRNNMGRNLKCLK